MTVRLITLDGSWTDLADDVLEALGGQLRGQVVVPASPSGVPNTRDVFNAMHVGQPAVIAQCADTDDVVHTVNFARKHNLTVAVRGGGHSVAGLPTIVDGLLIDLSAMRGVQVDHERRLAHVQGGAVVGDVDRATQKFGLATPLGVISSTGVGGLALGGGYGWLRRKYGLSCDNVVQARVVCADGQVRTASAEDNPDLFWAIRGGGGNFGIVTSFTFQLHPVRRRVAVAKIWHPLEDVVDVMRRWRDYVAEAPNEVTLAVVTLTFPADPKLPKVVHNRPCALIAGVHSGDRDDGMFAMEPLLEFGRPLFDKSQWMEYAEVQRELYPFFPRNTLRAYSKSQYLNKLTDDAINVIADRALNRPTPLTAVNIWHLGGAISDVSPEETTFAERSAPFMVEISGNWDDPADDAESIGWVRSASESIGAHSTGGVYLNLTSPDDEPMHAGVATALDPNLSRLTEIKERYDPDNFFRYNNIPPPQG